MTAHLRHTLLAALALGALAGCHQGAANPAATSSPGVAPAATPAHRLAREKSPYLRQHADNAVDWYPWGAEAFEKAKKENKPIFLSIGYSTCHWCHVMEAESFMNKEVGDYLNTYFVPIKVDRETRPDVDALYMDYVQRTTGSGGWPLSVFLSPDGLPLYGGTYFPQPAKYGKMGFLELLQTFHQAWTEKRKELLADASAFQSALDDEQKLFSSKKLPPKEILAQAATAQESRFDPEYGGFSQAPKFPNVPDLEYLLSYGIVHKDSKAVDPVRKTLSMMALGGLFDHLEGGFHRYSTDRRWLVPHFEKMLYDQALLIGIYAEGYAQKPELLYAETVEQTVSYLNTRCRSPEGGYYSAEDADSPLPGDPTKHAEGAFYVWSWKQLQAALKPEQLKKAEGLLGVTEAGNTGDDPSGELKGKNVLSLKRGEPTPEQTAILQKLREVRSKRPRPNQDRKVLTEWNAMLVTALAEAGRYLQEPGYLQQARKLMDFLDDKMVVEGKLFRSMLDGEPNGQAFASDYAQMVKAHLALFEAAGNPQDLEKAVAWQAQLDQLFWDDKGGYFTSPADSKLIYRKKDWSDGALLSANSCAAQNLVRLYGITGHKDYGDKAEKLFQTAATVMERSPGAVTGMLQAYQEWTGAHRSLILFYTDPQWLSKVSARYAPGLVLVPVSSAENAGALKKQIPFLPDWSGKGAAYFCEGFACKLPEGNLQAVLAKLPQSAR